MPADTTRARFRQQEANAPSAASGTGASTSERTSQSEVDPLVERAATQIGTLAPGAAWGEADPAVSVRRPHDVRSLQGAVVRSARSRIGACGLGALVIAFGALTLAVTQAQSSAFLVAAGFLFLFGSGGLLFAGHRVAFRYARAFEWSRVVQAVRFGEERPCWDVAEQPFPISWLARQLFTTGAEEEAGRVDRSRTEGRTGLDRSRPLVRAAVRTLERDREGMGYRERKLLRDRQLAELPAALRKRVGSFRWGAGYQTLYPVILLGLLAPVYGDWFFGTAVGYWSFVRLTLFGLAVLGGVGSSLANGISMAGMRARMEVWAEVIEVAAREKGGSSGSSATFAQSGRA